MRDHCSRLDCVIGGSSLLRAEIRRHSSSSGTLRCASSTVEPSSRALRRRASRSWRLQVLHSMITVSPARRRSFAGLHWIINALSDRRVPQTHTKRSHPFVRRETDAASFCGQLLGLRGLAAARQPADNHKAPRSVPGSGATVAASDFSHISSVPNDAYAIHRHRQDHATRGMSRRPTKKSPRTQAAKLVVLDTGMRTATGGLYR